MKLAQPGGFSVTQSANPLPSLSSRTRWLRDRIERVARRCGRAFEDIRVVAASKGQPWEVIWDAFDEGFRHFGENYVPEAVEKMEAFAQQGFGRELTWHLIGHLQTNKVKQAVGRFQLIQTVDSQRLAEAIDREAAARGTVQEVLIQVNVAGEASKSGVSPEALPALAETVGRMDHVRLRGLMNLPPPAPDAESLRPWHAQLRQLKEALNAGGTLPEPMTELSMGMSDDFETAIEEGATIVRIGTRLFGSRKD